MTRTSPVDPALAATEVTPLGPAGVAAAAAVLGRALADDPGWTYLFPAPDTRVARLTRLFERVVGRHYVGLGDSAVVDGAAAAIWAPPGAHAVPWPTALALAPRLGWLVGRRIPAALRLFRAMERRAPREPHHYLAALGVDPGHQGRGLGVAVVRPALDACDHGRTLAWLESANPKNHSFYRRLGFEVADELAVPGGPTLTWFARTPR